MNNYLSKNIYKKPKKVKIHQNTKCVFTFFYIFSKYLPISEYSSIQIAIKSKVKK